LASRDWRDRSARVVGAPAIASIPGADMTAPRAQLRYRAATMELVAYLDEQCVEMHIVTQAGETVAITCAKDSIFQVARQITRMGNDCPEIATWGDGAAPSAR
jgi:hypothetical protein